MASPSFRHGLCLIGSAPAAWDDALSPLLARFERVSSEPPERLQWISGSPRNILTVILAEPEWGLLHRHLVELRECGRTVFKVVWHPDATEDPTRRVQAFAAGARMVTNNTQHLAQALEQVRGVEVLSLQGGGTATCPWCGLEGLTPLELWTHQPLWHIYEPERHGNCPVCTKDTTRLTRHISLTHGSVPGVDHCTGVFALAVVRRPSDGKFLLVQERYREGYWIPGGGVDPGESLTAGVVREAREEAGADIKVTGILTIESAHAGDWRRIIFLAEPASPDPSAAALCKTLPDVESAGACWATAEEVPHLPLRCASEPLTWIPWVAGGGRVMPCDPEGCPDLRRVFPDVPL